MKDNNIFYQLYNKFINNSPNQNNNFILTKETNKDIEKVPINATKSMEPTDISNKYDDNLNYMKVKYNSLINSDVVIREFNITANTANFKAFLIFIDGMVDTQIINTSVLKPLMLNHLSPNTSNIKNRKSHIF
jgi:hypothetical protein